MSPRPQDRLIASQALLHPWIKAIEDESDPNPTVNVEESPVIPCDGDEQSQHTQASAVWTQDTTKSMGHLADQNDGNLRVSKDDDEPATTRVEMDSIVADTTVTAKITTQKRHSGSGKHLKVEKGGEPSFIDRRSAEPDKDDYSQSKEPSRPKSNSEASEPHESTLTEGTYMEDADEDGNPIEGTRVYIDKPLRQPRINVDSGSRNELFKRDETQLHSHSRSPSPARHGHQTLRPATQDRAVHSRDGQTQDYVDTSPSDHPKVTTRVHDSCNHDRTAQNLNKLTPEYSESHKILNCELQELIYGRR